MNRIRVEVFPVEPDRWISVINAPKGAFSTEVRSPKDVDQDVRASAAAVLGTTDLEFDYVDDLDAQWTPAQANAQLQRLGVRFQPRRRNRLVRFFRGGDNFRGDCLACDHDWREHIPRDGECSECVYEIEHEEPDEPTSACRLMPAPVAGPVPDQRSEDQPDRPAD